MKKIFSIFAIVAVMALFASCKNNEQAVVEEQGLAEQVDTTVVAVDSTAVDSTAVEQVAE